MHTVTTLASELPAHLSDDPVIITVAEAASHVKALAVLWLFGSRARNDAAPSSDYDFAIALNNFDLTYAQRRLAPELLAMDWSLLTQHTVQVIDINLAPLPLAVNILAEGTPILIDDTLRYCREQNRVDGLWQEYNRTKETLA